MLMDFFRKKKSKRRERVSLKSNLRSGLKPGALCEVSSRNEENFAAKLEIKRRDLNSDGKTQTVQLHPRSRCWPLHPEITHFKESETHRSTRRVLSIRLDFPTPLCPGLVGA